ncbi:efflux RND transporter permease subunit, partial [bacterium]|nr:efflux RND transporter permease subunit [bacterium]
MIRAALNNPYAAFVGMAIVVIFGIISMGAIPIQLKPTIEPPEISVQTFYFGASPLEVEDQITNELEEGLSSISDLRKITSSSNDGYSSISLEFVTGVDRNKALLEVSQAVERATDLPEDIVGPIIAMVSAAQNEQIMWLTVEGGASLEEKHDLVKEVIEPTIRRVSGVGYVQ